MQVMEFEAALGVVMREAARLRALSLLEAERVGLLESAGRVLARAIRADRDQPPFDRATRDGFAVRAADAGKTFQVIGQVRAGDAWAGPPLGDEETIEIMTGAPVPARADAVVMVEHVSVANGMLRIPAERTLRSGENVCCTRKRSAGRRRSRSCRHRNRRCGDCPGGDLRDARPGRLPKAAGSDRGHRR